MDEIPLCAPTVGNDEARYLQECIDTGWVSSAGPFVDQFEERIAEEIGSSRAVATASGTAALHVALRAAGVGEGDAVLMNTLTFIAPANAVRYLGAQPIFLDAEPEYLQLDPEALRIYLETRCERTEGGVVDKRTGARIRALLVVHVLGHPADVEAIAEIADEYDLAVVEDVAESLGALYDGDPVGSHGDISCFSFNGNKIITAGGGGMVVTDREDWAEDVRYLTTQAKDDPLRYVHENVGYNYRLSNLHAGVGLAQLDRLEDHVEAKRTIARRYTKAFSDLRGVEPMREAPNVRATYWLYTIRIDPDVHEGGWSAFHEALDEREIQTRPIWQPVHLSPAHDGLSGDCEAAERIHSQLLSLPSSVGLSPTDQDCVVDAIRTHAQRG